MSQLEVAVTRLKLGTLKHVLDFLVNKSRVHA
jgi:hypothetical protein